MKVTRPMRHTKIVTFDNLQEVTNHINHTPITDIFQGKPGGVSSKKEGNESWSGTRTFEEALELFKNGWTEKAKEIESKLSKKLTKEAAPVMRQRSVYDVVGGNCSVPRYLQGVPNSMIRQVRQPVKEKIVTINYNIGYGYGVTAEKIINNALECLSQIKNLEDKGTRVNLNVVLAIKSPDFSHGVKWDFVWVIPVKKSSERISIAKIAFAVCHPAMLRRIALALIERDSDVTSDFVDGYGSSIRDSKTLKQLLPDTEIFETKF